jgi:hypothetical protein
MAADIHDIRDTGMFDLAAARQGPVALKEDLQEALYYRDYYTREVREAEALLAHVTARVQKRKDTAAKYDARILELRTQAHLLGLDRSFGEDLMGEPSRSPR